MGNQILYRGIRDGLPVQTKVKFSPTLFTVTREDSEWKTLDGRNAEKREFSTMRKANDFLKQYTDVDNFEVHGYEDFAMQYVQSRWPTSIDYDFDKIRIANIDIEVQSDDGFPNPNDAEKEIISISLKASNESYYRVWGLDFYDVKESPYRGKIEYYQFDSEREMLYDFLKYWKDHYPDIITGWSVETFDIKYMVNRYSKVFGYEIAKYLSPWNKINTRARFLKNIGKEIEYYELLGITILDYIDVFKKFDKTYGPQESYKLDHISYVVLGERKLSYEDHENLFTLISGSKEVTVSPDKPKEKMETFEKWCSVRDKVKAKLKEKKDRR